MNKDYTFSKELFTMLDNAKKMYSQPENRLAYVLDHKTKSTEFRNFLKRRENINKVIEIMYQNHPFYRESEFISIEKAVDLAFRFYEVKVATKEEEFIGTIMSSQHKFYFKYEHTNEYCVLSLEEFLEIFRNFKLEGSKFNGQGASRRLVENLKENNKLVKFEY